MSERSASKDGAGGFRPISSLLENERRHRASRYCTVSLILHLVAHPPNIYPQLFDTIFHLMISVSIGPDRSCIGWWR